MKSIDVGKEFSSRLANRNTYQGDGKFTAIEFRKKFLKECESRDFWSNDENVIEFDFSNVRKVGPSFANEAFAYFMKDVDKKTFYKHILFKNISEVKKLIIDQELETGYSK